MPKKKCIYTMKRAKLNVVKTPTQRQLNNNSTKVGCDTKMTLHTTPPHDPTPPPQKLNVCNISAVTDPISTKL